MPLEQLISKLAQTHRLTHDEFKALLDHRSPALAEKLAALAVPLRRQYYGTDVYLRGLIEFTSYCRNDCYYCGLRRSNRHAERYRLTEEDILGCCDRGEELGFRTFVLQGGEDPYFTTDRLARLVEQIKKAHPSCAVTLSVGERPRQDYQRWFDAGAERFLLRHETADPAHYAVLHPPEMSWEHRMRCLRDLKEIGYQTGAGVMIGSPGQTTDELAQDLCFMQDFQPEMVGIGPFIPQHDTPFRDKPAGTLELTLYMLSLTRLILPNVLLPATTALGTIDPTGREKGILAGANVCMPNLSPLNVRKKYALYDNKICTGDEAAESCRELARRMEAIGYHVALSRGDHRPLTAL